MTLEFAARTLHVPNALLAGLEAGAFGAFGAPIYYLGHLRRYAVWLELDPEALIRTLPDPGSGEPALPFPPDSDHTWPSGSRAWLGVTAGLLLVGAILAVLWLVLGSGPSVHPLPPLPRVVALQPKRPTRAHPVPSLPHPRPISVPKLRLRFVLTRSSWIAVTSAGHTVYAKLVKQGTLLHLLARPPVRIVLGDTRGLAFFVDGKRFALSPWTGADHVAVLSIAPPLESPHP